jgi:glycine/D-amino acid oxidase-like deaminating enzyme
LKTIAIIGAGFAGLAAALRLSKDFKVSLFDAEGVGKGASGASTGLLHPYAGEQGRRSWKADEGMKATLCLLDIAEQEMGKPVALRNGIVKIGECSGAGEDVEKLGDNQFLIHSGVTVFTSLYIEGLWRGCEKNGVELRLERVQSLEGLSDFDYIVVAAGSGIRSFPQASHLKINFVKGQALLCELREPVERSITGKQYTALTDHPGVCHVGATYERYFTSEYSSLEIALHLLRPTLPVLGVKSGIRVTNPAHYFPILEKLDERTWVVTALGSRGLLYHAYLAEQLATECLKCVEEECLI